MINILQGKIIEINSQNLTLDISGFGFSVSVPNENLFTLNQDTKFFIYFHWNQENGPQLFGFTSKVAKDVFMLILSCSGLGPKIGLAILNQLSPEQFVNAIAFSNIEILNKINGIGLKKAELMIAQLKDKIKKIDLKDFNQEENIGLIKINEVIDALTSLNYTRQEISAAVEYTKKQEDFKNYSFDQILRKSLSYLAKRV